MTGREVSVTAAAASLLSVTMKTIMRMMRMRMRMLMLLRLVIDDWLLRKLSGAGANDEDAHVVQTGDKEAGAFASSKSHARPSRRACAA